ncbi:MULTISPECIES: ABC transporter ATP-binding protein [Mesorhizobium]|uniref:ABC transporter ATP-binding protein n=1 Tax=Mesorhizobium TaxID=68287 RepID=UPI0010A95913|nr:MULTISPECIES: ABC transporter ATP-binding protein [Mesorhizobium]
MTIQIAAFENPRSNSDTEASAIDLRKVSVRFTTDRGTVTALENIDLSVPIGGFLTLLGPSGCGKSTLLRVIADLIAPTSGNATVLGGSPSLARARRDIGFVFQDAALLPWRTALQNVALPLEVGGISRPGRRSPAELLALVGLSGWENAYPHELSGGMRQRVAIARALVNDPRLLLMDEPFGALDEITRDRLNEELLDVWASTGTTILFVTHSIYEAAFLAERVLLLAANPGRIKEIVPVSLPSPRRIALRETTEFTKLAGRLRAILETC